MRAQDSGGGQSGGTDARRARTANLDADRVEAIVRLINRLPGKPTWHDVTATVRDRLGLPYTRQTLHAHPAIRIAFQARKRGILALPGPRPISARAAAELQEKTRLRTELEAANQLAARLIEKHLTWLHNAHTKCSMTEADLDHPLPPSGRT